RAAARGKDADAPFLPALEVASIADIGVENAGAVRCPARFQGSLGVREADRVAGQEGAVKADDRRGRRLTVGARGEHGQSEQEAAGGARCDGLNLRHRSPDVRVRMGDETPGSVRTRPPDSRWTIQGVTAIQRSESRPGPNTSATIREPSGLIAGCPPPGSARTPAPPVSRFTACNIPSGPIASSQLPAASSTVGELVPKSWTTVSSPPGASRRKIRLSPLRVKKMAPRAAATPVAVSEPGTSVTTGSGPTVT